MFKSKMPLFILIKIPFLVFAFWMVFFVSCGKAGRTLIFMFNSVFLVIENLVIAKRSDEYIKNNFRIIYDTYIERIYSKYPWLSLRRGVYPPFFASYMDMKEMNVEGLEDVKREVRLHYFHIIVVFVENFIFVFADLFM